MPSVYVEIIQAYLPNRHFVIAYSCYLPLPSSPSSSSARRCLFFPTMYFFLYTADSPVHPNVTVATFADDTAIISRLSQYSVAILRLQKGTEKVSKWAKKWRFHINEGKSVRIDFTLRSHPYAPTLLDGKTIPLGKSARYLGLHLDSKLNWQEHVHKKRDHIKAQLRKYYWLIGYHSQLSLENNCLIYRAIIKPSWTYGIPVWGTIKRSNRLLIQRVQNEALLFFSISRSWYGFKY